MTQQYAPDAARVDRVAIALLAHARAASQTPEQAEAAWHAADDTYRDSVRGFARAALSVTDASQAQGEVERLRAAIEQIAVNSNCDWDVVRKNPAKQIDIIHALAVEAFYASPAPGATAQDGAVVDRLLNTTGVDDRGTASDVTQATPTVPSGMVAVPVEPTEAWVHSLANWRQGQRDTPRCEPPGAYELNRAREDIRAVLAVAPKQAEQQGVERYLADRFEWAAPGDQQEDAWIVRFCDNDVRDMLFTGPDAEREAWDAWNAHAPGYNMYVFRLAALNAPTGAVQKGEAK